MRVVSLVPSWTEMLIEAGVDVVGRTRYCIHPKDKVDAIPTVGGTKNLKIDKLKELHPDFVVVDKEENTKEMAAACSYPLAVTHIQSIDDLPDACEYLANNLQSEAIGEFSKRWRQILEANLKIDRFEALPGVLEWIKKPESSVEKVVYLIWKKPWMAVNKDTFIGSIFDRLGVDISLDTSAKYPEVNLEELDPNKTLLLFSSEPYPFETKRADIKALGFPSALVDGESFSWFGSRSLRFLEKLTSS